MSVFHKDSIKPTSSLLLGLSLCGPLSTPTHTHARTRAPLAPSSLPVPLSLITSLPALREQVSLGGTCPTKAGLTPLTDDLVLLRLHKLLIYSDAGESVRFVRAAGVLWDGLLCCSLSVESNVCVGTNASLSERQRRTVFSVLYVARDEATHMRGHPVSRWRDGI